MKAFLSAMNKTVLCFSYGINVTYLTLTHLVILTVINVIIMVGNVILNTLVIYILTKANTVWKLSKYGVISGPYFLVFSPNTGKYGPEITPYLDTSIWKQLSNVLYKVILILSISNLPAGAVAQNLFLLVLYSPGCQIDSAKRTVPTFSTNISS